MQKIHHKTLRVIYQSDESYKNLHNLDNSVSLHQRHLKNLVTEVFMCESKANPKCHYHVQRLQCMERILCILKVLSFEITFSILLNPVPQYFNLKEI